MENTIRTKVEAWLSGDYDAATKEEIKRMMQEDPEKLTDAFYKDLEFGTGGLRGVMGVGTNRMNKYTVGAATQGLANYLKKQLSREKIKVAIAFDSRNLSSFFARITAEILSANQISCYLFEDLRPTPELSFTVRHLSCHAGIVITASHNPKEYNGYKVYWRDGGQLVPPHDKNVISEVKKIDSIQEICWRADESLIHMIGKEVDESYLNQIQALSLNPGSIASQAEKIKIVYTPLHGAGVHVVPDALRRYGFTNIYLEEQQVVIDGDFPTVVSPNPEEKSALTLALAAAEKLNADLVMATDPDADRVGVAVRDADGKLVLLNGNAIASLLTYYVLSEKKRQGTLQARDFVVKTVVTTDLIKDIAEDFQVDCFEVLTGFKYIAEQINKKEGKARFLCGGEESYGFLTGDFVRDKDAVSTCCLIAEMVAVMADRGKSLLSLLDEIFIKYALYQEVQVSLTRKGKQGADEIQQMMLDFRERPPVTINGSPVIKITDYLLEKEQDITNHSFSRTALPVSDVVQFFMADGSSVTVRPSGTEPKIKFYISVKEKVEASTLAATKIVLEERVENIKESIHLK